MTILVETKGIIEDLTRKFVELLNLGSMFDVLSKEIRKQYQIGLDKAEVQFDMNFSFDQSRYNLLENYTFDNIKGMTDDMADKLRSELQRGLMNLESVDKLKERVQKVMDVSAERARMIARTEANRAENMGHIDGARQSDVKLMKKWDAHLDNRTSAVCNDLDGKIIPLDKKFKWNGQEFDAPPAHPNCRSTLLFVPIKIHL